MACPQVLIAGGGIGGLTAALALLRRGFDVTVFELADILGEVGAGVQIASDGSRVLIELGLRDALEAVVCEAERKEVRLWDTGRTWPLFDLGRDSRERFGAPYWFVHRGDLHRILREAVIALKPDAIRAGHRCVSYSQSDDKIELEIEGNKVFRGDVLVGADGVHSKMRSIAFGASTPHYTGIIAWRGLVPMEALPRDLRRAVGTNWVGPGGHVITYPLCSGRVMNFAGFAERSDWREESWSTAGTREECARDFKGWQDLIHAMIEQIDTPYKWALIGREPLQTWADGRFVLLGDACHPTLPFLAHGAIMAIEDGMVLARCLEHQPDDIQGALLRYQHMRVSRTTAIVRGSAENAKRFHNPLLKDPSAAPAYIEREWAPDKVRIRYDWLFEYDAVHAPLDEVPVETT
jgi:salicylate hydroxylase